MSRYSLSLPWGRHVPSNSWIAGVPAFQKAPVFHQSETSGVAGRAFARRSPGLNIIYGPFAWGEPFLLISYLFRKTTKKQST